MARRASADERSGADTGRLFAGSGAIFALSSVCRWAVGWRRFIQCRDRPVALNHLWGCGLSTDELAALGLTLGRDVPVFVRGHAAFAEGWVKSFPG